MTKELDSWRQKILIVDCTCCILRESLVRIIHWSLKLVPRMYCVINDVKSKKNPWKTGFLYRLNYSYLPICCTSPAYSVYLSALQKKKRENLMILKAKDIWYRLWQWLAFSNRIWNLQEKKYRSLSHLLVGIYIVHDKVQLGTRTCNKDKRGKWLRQEWRRGAKADGDRGREG